MADGDTTRTLTLEIKATDQATAVIDQANRKALSAAKLQAAEYRSLFRDTVRDLKAQESAGSQAQAEAVSKALNAAKLQAAEYRSLFRDTVREIKEQEAAASQSNAAAITKAIQRQYGGEESSFRQASLDRIAQLQRAQQAPAGEGGLRGELDEARNAFGRGSSFTQVARGLAGAGPLLGFGLAARELKEATDHAIEFRKALTDGTATSGELAAGLLKSIPLLGSIVDAGQNIRELFTGERQEIERINELAKLQEQHVQSVTKAVREQHDEHVSLANAARAARQELDRSGLEGSANQIARVQQESFNAKADAGDERKKGLEKINQRFDADQKALREKLQEIEHRKVYGLTPDSVRAQTQANEVEADAVRQQLAQNDKEKSRQTKEFNADFNKKNATEEQARQFQIIREREQADRAQDEQVRAGQLQTEQTVREGQKRIADLRAADRAESLKLAGDGYAAEREQLKASLDQQAKDAQDALETAQEQIRHDFAEQVRKAEHEFEDTPQRQYLIDQLTKQANEKLAALKAQADAVAQSIEQRRGFGEEKIRRQEQIESMQEESLLRRQELADIDAKLAAEGRVTSAQREQLQIQEQFAQRRAELTKQLQSANLAPQTRDKLQQELSGLDAEEKAAQGGRANRSIEDVGKSLLQGAASTGNRQAEIAVRKFDIVKKYRDEAAQLQELLADKNLSKDQRTAAEQALAFLPQAQESEIAKANRTGVTQKFTADSLNNAGGGLTGIGLAAREDAAKAQHEEAAKSNAKLDKLIELMTKLLLAGQQHQPQGPPPMI